ncbi:MAG: hypothetical protein IPM79_01995 [Polyangiaceae bacterium]|nr:hypothetical protein [Polyangiaceae bacterium]MBK8936439.1 hypothetical protein [Polyangiaceae bacterium]
MAQRVVALAALFTLSACGSSGEGATSAKPSATAPAPGATGATDVRPSSLTWTAPAGFTLAPSPSPMRLATYKIAKVAGDAEDAEMTVSQVGGGLESNMARWKGQVADGAVREETTVDVGNLKVSILWVEGTYKGMGGPNAPAAAKGEYALLGAGVASGQGAEHYFKITGPKKTVEAARPAFEELVKSFAAK